MSPVAAQARLRSAKRAREKEAVDAAVFRMLLIAETAWVASAHSGALSGVPVRALTAVS